MQPGDAASVQMVELEPAQAAQAWWARHRRSGDRLLQARALTSEERITISDEARMASRDALPPPTGDVKSYRAPRCLVGEAATAAFGGAGAPSAAGVTVHRAVQAYRRHVRR